MNRLALILLLCCLPSLLGCMGAGGVPLPVERLESLRAQFEDLDRANEGELKDRIRLLQDEVARIRGTKDKVLRAEAARKQLLLGYCWERLGEFADAKRFYFQAAKGEYGSVAQIRIAQVAEYQTNEYRRQSSDPDVPSDRRQEAAALQEETRKQAVRALERCSAFPVGARGLLRRPEVASLVPASWTTTELRHEAYRRLDAYYRSTASYRVFETLVRICGGAEKSISYALALVLLAVLAKLITTPLL